MNKIKQFSSDYWGGQKRGLPHPNYWGARARAAPRVYAYVCIHASRSYVCMNVYMYACVSLYIYVCVQLCMHVCVYVSMQAYIVWLYHCMSTCINVLK